MYLAKLNTTNFEFLAIDQDKEGAIELLKKAWNRHAEEYGASYDWDFVSDSVSVIFTRSGDVWRDGDLMHSYDSAECWTNQRNRKQNRKKERWNTQQFLNYKRKGFGQLLTKPQTAI